MVVAKAVLDSVMQRGHVDTFEIVGECNGQQLAGIQLQTPIFTTVRYRSFVESMLLQRLVRGLVHTAPAHGEDDYQVGKAHSLLAESPVGSNGCFKDDVELVGGAILQ